MKQTSLMLAIAAVSSIALSSCFSNYSRMDYATTGARSGAGGASTGIVVDKSGESKNSYDLVPVGDIITYTIDIKTPEGRQKLQGLSLNEAKKLAETEALRKYKCNSFIDPHFDYLMSEDGLQRILRITIDGQPAKYKIKSK